MAGDEVAEPALDEEPEQCLESDAEDMCPFKPGEGLAIATLGRPQSSQCIIALQMPEPDVPHRFTAATDMPTGYASTDDYSWDGLIDAYTATYGVEGLVDLMHTLYGRRTFRLTPEGIVDEGEASPKWTIVLFDESAHYQAYLEHVEELEAAWEPYDHPAAPKHFPEPPYVAAGEAIDYGAWLDPGGEKVIYLKTVRRFGGSYTNQETAEALRYAVHNAIGGHDTDLRRATEIGLGVVSMIGGAADAVVGGLLIATGVGAVLGIPLLLLGLDGWQAGGYLISNSDQESFGEHWAGAAGAWAAGELGQDEGTGKTAGKIALMIAGLAAGFSGASKLAKLKALKGSDLSEVDDLAKLDEPAAALPPAQGSKEAHAIETTLPGNSGNPTTTQVALNEKTYIQTSEATRVNGEVLPKDTLHVSADPTEGLKTSAKQSPPTRDAHLDEARQDIADLSDGSLSTKAEGNAPAQRPLDSADFEDLVGGVREKLQRAERQIDDSQILNQDDPAAVQKLLDGLEDLQEGADDLVGFLPAAGKNPADEALVRTVRKEVRGIYVRFVRAIANLRGQRLLHLFTHADNHGAWRGTLEASIAEAKGFRIILDGQSIDHLSQMLGAMNALRDRITRLEAFIPQARKISQRGADELQKLLDHAKFSKDLMNRIEQLCEAIRNNPTVSKALDGHSLQAGNAPRNKHNTAATQVPAVTKAAGNEQQLLTQADLDALNLPPGIVDDLEEFLEDLVKLPANQDEAADMLPSMPVFVEP